MSSNGRFKPARRGLLSAQYDRDVVQLVSAFVLGVRNAPKTALPKLERAMVEVLTSYIEFRMKGAIFPSRITQSRAGKKGRLNSPGYRKLPAASELGAELEALLRTRSIRDARSIIHNKYRSRATRQAINDALVRAGHGMKSTKKKTES